jgi:hypothetical protein
MAWGFVCLAIMCPLAMAAMTTMVIGFVGSLGTNSVAQLLVVLLINNHLLMAGVIEEVKARDAYKQSSCLVIGQGVEQDTCNNPHGDDLIVCFVPVWKV